MYKFEEILFGNKSELLKQANIPKITPQSKRVGGGNFSKDPLGGKGFAFTGNTSSTNQATGNVGGTGTVTGNIQPAQNQPFKRISGFQYGKGPNGQRGYQYDDGFDYTNVNWDNELEYINRLEREQLQKDPAHATQIRQAFQQRRQALNTYQRQAAFQYFDDKYNKANDVGKLGLLDPLNGARDNQYNRNYRPWYSAWQDNNRGRWQPQAPVSNEQVLANSSVPWIADKYRKQIGQQNWNANADNIMHQQAQQREQQRQWQAQRDLQDAQKAIDKYDVGGNIKGKMTPQDWVAMNPLQRGEYINNYNRDQYAKRVNNISEQITNADMPTNSEIPRYLSTKDYAQYRNNMLRVHGKAWDARGFDDAARDKYIRESYEARLRGMDLNPDGSRIVAQNQQPPQSEGVTQTAQTATAQSTAPQNLQPIELTPSAIEPDINPQVESNKITQVPVSTNAKSVSFNIAKDNNGPPYKDVNGNPIVMNDVNVDDPNEDPEAEDAMPEITYYRGMPTSFAGGYFLPREEKAENTEVKQTPKKDGIEVKASANIMSILFPQRARDIVKEYF